MSNMRREIPASRTGAEPSGTTANYARAYRRKVWQGRRCMGRLIACFNPRPLDCRSPSREWLPQLSSSARDNR